MTTIDRDQLKRMIEEDAVIPVEVLDKSEFDAFHLPRALNVPLAGDFDERVRSVLPDLHQPVALYCRDEACDASQRAAQRMAALGYDRVYEYGAGKADWKAAGFPGER